MSDLTDDAIEFYRAEFRAEDEDKIIALLQELEHLRYSLDVDGTRHKAERLGSIICRFELVLNVKFYPTPDESAGLLVLLNPIDFFDDSPF